MAEKTPVEVWRLIFEEAIAVHDILHLRGPYSERRNYLGSMDSHRYYKRRAAELETRRKRLQLVCRSWKAEMERIGPILLARGGLPYETPMLLPHEGIGVRLLMLDGKGLTPSQNLSYVTGLSYELFYQSGLMSDGKFSIFSLGSLRVLTFF